MPIFGLREKKHRHGRRCLAESVPVIVVKIYRYVRFLSRCLVGDSQAYGNRLQVGAFARF